MPTPNPGQKYGPAVSLGLNLTVGMVVFSGIGYFIDQKQGGGSVFTLGGMFLGLFYCGYEVWKLVRRMDEEQKNKS